MIEIYDANAYLRSDLNRTDGLSQLSPRFIYEAVNASPHQQLWVWDGPRNNERRRALFPPYKQRDYTGQENVFAGLQVYRDLLTHSRAVQFEVPEYEADDVCATLAWRYTKAGIPVTIYTNDFDFFQLTTNHLITLKGVRPVEGVPARYVSLYKALRGDPSDKIHGMPGFGPKSWESMRGLHEQLNTAFQQRDTHALRNMPFKPAQRTWLALDENVELLFVFYQITQMLQVPDDLLEQHLKPGVFDPVAAHQIFSRFFL